MDHSSTVTVALISEVFHGTGAEQRLSDRLADAKSRGASIALLPELPLNPWSPATQSAREDDAELPNGVRHQIQSSAAAKHGLGLIGGAIVRDSQTGVRRNTALVFDQSGKLVGSFSKQHLPQEDGFWETSHYAAGEEPSPVVRELGIPFGVQICSDINRPEGCHILGAMGGEAVFAPRATEQRTAERWKLVFRANALTSSVFILSANRPAPEQGVLIGGPSFAIAPDGSVLLETTDRVGIVTLDRTMIAKAREDYPGYLPIRASAYARAWASIADKAYGPNSAAPNPVTPSPLIAS